MINWTIEWTDDNQDICSINGYNIVACYSYDDLQILLDEDGDAWLRCDHEIVAIPSCYFGDLGKALIALDEGTLP